MEHKKINFDLKIGDAARFCYGENKFLLTIDDISEDKVVEFTLTSESHLDFELGKLEQVE